MIHRRRFLQTAGATAALVAASGRSHGQAAPSCQVLETRIISHDPYYHGWPTVTRRRSGQLLLVYSGGREAHVCPFGRVEMMVSHDEGHSWGWPRVLLDSDIDDRDAGVVETARGTLLVTTFTSLAYETTLEKAAAAAATRSTGSNDARLSDWRAAHQRLTPEQRQAELGQWMIRSTDDGRTWSPRYSCIVDSPHGPVQLADGRLLYAGKELWTGDKRVGVCQSLDDGQSWQWLAEIPTRPDDRAADYHELHAIEATDGRLIVQIRNHNRENHRETLQSESTDGGRTWSTPRAIGVWGLPSHLLRLRSGHLLMTYGYRREPFGNQARLSRDHGRSWSAPLTISADGNSGDLGYPSTVELADGALLTIWYELLKDSSRAVLRQARWSLQS